MASAALLAAGVSLMACSSSDDDTGNSAGTGGTATSGGSGGSGGSQGGSAGSGGAPSGGTGNSATGGNSSGGGGATGGSSGAGASGAGASTTGGSSGAGARGGSSGAGGSGGTAGGSDLPSVPPETLVQDLDDAQKAEICDWMVGLFGGYDVTTECPVGSVKTYTNQEQCVMAGLSFTCKTLTVGELEACRLSEVPSGGCDLSDESCKRLQCVH